MRLNSVRLGEELFRLRVARGLTMIEAARRAHCSRMTVYSVETGTSDPSLSTFVALCLALEAEPYKVLRTACGDAK